MTGAALEAFLAEDDRRRRRWVIAAPILEQVERLTSDAARALRMSPATFRTLVAATDAAVSGAGDAQYILVATPCGVVRLTQSTDVADGLVEVAP